MYCRWTIQRAIPILERSIDVPVLEDGQDHALAKFAG
ncbi:kinesin light chain, partial [Trifolium medium]|nr:kinesin light chain [Trifolium medium]